jgi:hypothetical protein
VSIGEQQFAEVAADEAGAAGDEVSWHIFVQSNQA